jgi:hypothetical protein
MTSGATRLHNAPSNVHISPLIEAKEKSDVWIFQVEDTDASRYSGAASELASPFAE